MKNIPPRSLTVAGLTVIWPSVFSEQASSGGQNISFQCFISPELRMSLILKKSAMLYYKYHFCLGFEISIFNAKDYRYQFHSNDLRFTYSLLNFFTHGLFFGNANERRWVRNVSWDDSKSHLPVILFCSFIIRSILSFHSMYA